MKTFVRLLKYNGYNLHNRLLLGNTRQGSLPASCSTWCNFSFVQSESRHWVRPWAFCSVLPEQGCFLHYLPHVASTHLPLGSVATETVKKAKLWILQNTPCSWHWGSVLNKCTMLKGEAQSTNCTTPMNTSTHLHPCPGHFTALGWLESTSKSL